MSSEEKESLEKILDRNSLSNLLEALSEICYAKAQHINENWQDNNLARIWERAGNKLAVDAIKSIITAVP